MLAEWLVILIVQFRPHAARFFLPTCFRLKRFVVVNLRVTVGTIVGLIAAGRTIEEVLDAYPYLEREDILETLSYAAWRAEEIEVSLAS
jgi:uncharacterized protein (DUF433 family)